MVNTMSTMTDEIFVGEVMMDYGSFPIVSQKELLKETIIEMSYYGLGIACIVDSQKKLKGVFTDGDIRRLILKVQKPIAALFVDDVQDYSTKRYSSVLPNTSLREAIIIMEKLNIWDLPVVDENKVLKGLLHLHPALKKLLYIE